jgi:hypothetical protein
MTHQEIIELRKATARWPAIPDGCPQRFVERICETRAAILRGEKVEKPHFERTRTAPFRQTAPSVSSEDGREQAIKRLRIVGLF